MQLVRESLAVRRETPGVSAPNPHIPVIVCTYGITMTAALATCVHAQTIAFQLGEPGPDQTARATTRPPRPSVAVITVHGEIDASNAGIITELAADLLTRCDGVILDLEDLEFIGTEGFSALLRVFVSCARTGTGWVVVAGAAVFRLLRICDPQGSIPAVSSVDAAMDAFPWPPLHRLQRVATALH